MQGNLPYEIVVEYFLSQRGYVIPPSPITESRIKNLHTVVPSNSTQ